MKYVAPLNGDQSNADRPYVDANPATGIEGSIPSAAAIEHPMREIVEVIKSAGLEPDETNLKQLKTAIEKMSRLEVNSAIARAVPAGVCVPFGGEKAPAGWLSCNGAAVSRTAYAQLFDAIGTIYGEGDGSSTFNLPDMRGEFLRGLDEGRGVDVGRVIGSYQAGTKICGEGDPAQSAGFNAHTIHNITDVYADPVYETSFDKRIEYDTMTDQQVVQDNVIWWRTVRPRNVTMPFIIKF